MRKLFLHIGQLVMVFILLVASACEKATEWKTQSSSPVLIVDALITSENTNHLINVSLSSSELNASSSPVSGVVLKISGNNQIYTFTELSENIGTYRSDQTFNASGGIEYLLTLEYQGFFDTAYCELEAITPMETILVTSNDEYYNFNYQSSSEPSMMEVFYDWSENPEFCEYYGFCSAAETHYTLDNIDVSKIFAPDKQLISFPSGTEIIRRKYSLSEEHQYFIRSILLETEWRGGVFDIEQGNIPTNFNNGTYGWFACSMVLSDTSYID